MTDPQYQFTCYDREGREIGSGVGNVPLLWHAVQVVQRENVPDETARLVIERVPTPHFTRQILTERRLSNE